jgi:anti-anti-sigma factor
VVDVASGRGADYRVAPDFVVRTVWVPPRAVMTLSGELDIASVEVLTGSVEALLSIQPPAQEIIINMRALRFADVGGTRGLLTSCRRLGQTSVVEVRGVSASIQRVLDLARLTCLPAATPRRKVRRTTRPPGHYMRRRIPACDVVSSPGKDHGSDRAL